MWMSIKVLLIVINAMRVTFIYKAGLLVSSKKMAHSIVNYKPIFFWSRKVYTQQHLPSCVRDREKGKREGAGFINL